MTNCPNCGAVIDLHSWRCPYCSTIYFDFVAMNLEDSHPCFIKFKTTQGIITCLARPKIETVEVGSDYSYITDHYNNIVKSYISKRTCDINVKFSCCENPKTKTLFQIEI